MKISKPVKILIGVLTFFAVFFPFVIMPAFMMFFMYNSGFPFLYSQTMTNPDEMIKAMMPMMIVFYPTVMCYSLVQLGLQVFYIIHEIKNKALTDTFRILFAIGTFMLPYVAMPIYFIAYLWKDNPPTSKSSPAEITS